MIFTLESLYALHMLNYDGYSEDLFLLPLPEVASEEKTAQLKEIIEQGFSDLQAMGLIDENNEPTTACLAKGTYLQKYQEAYSHCEVDDQYYCAQLVDSNRWYHIVIETVDENAYRIDRIHSFQFLGMTIQSHPFLSQIPEREINPAAPDWKSYSEERLIIYYGKAPALRVTSYSGQSRSKDYLYLNAPSALYQYDIQEQRIRSISTDNMKKEIIDQLKVRIQPCPKLVFP
ncbi:DUF5081 family protein [Streptococcus sanguinis]|uniref:DUF5081 family protein n=1 Tax=Streptococcus sanguinis TaxID=1305 RepID=UPI001CBE7100|nr:DUF5081 family protein [Streptococcus sanguinis]MBZ2065762.1 DUF5081 family protein [Streptococcus sanguinis]